jgi:FtsP/CotA-like multicopper oxidase with cupredoxin domain
VRLEHHTPDHVYDLGGFTVTDGAPGAAAGSFGVLRTDPELTAEHQAIGGDIEREPDKVLAFYSLMPLLYGGDNTPASSYVCPMHPEVTAAEPGTCPRCGMKLVAVAVTYACPMHPQVTAAEPGVCPDCGMKLVPGDAPLVPAAQPDQGEAHGGHDHGDGLEWEDLMPEINRASDSGNMIWQLIDRQTGAVNGDISWSFTVGDRVKIRLVNEMDADHPMHHPFHVHGAGRFLVLSRDDKPEANLVWKDTVLLRAGETVDILLDVSNPGLWMAHCHIAEHNQSGMMFSFNVARRPEQAR